MAKKREKKAPSPFALAVGARLRAARRAAGIKLAQLGEQLEVSGQQIQNYEAGKSRLSDETIVRACEALRIEPNHLLGWNEKIPPKTRPHFIVFGRQRSMIMTTDYDGLFEAGFLMASH
ncbi:helix-turn-helix domain-containing protein [Bradyrhizobium sp. STM 3566]|uniref:helix-turn-helix domain-containing protein n=1 Tax=Bradyrhizobium sp. STM 3566 TaxID=578928 RepID=UPI00388F812A